MAALITAPRLMSIGGGALAELPSLLARLGLERPLIVTDPYIAGCGILDRATALLDKAQVPWAVFSDTVPDPTTDAIAAGVERLKEGDYDSLVAIGGGSSIDTAKGMSVLYANGGKMSDYKVPNDIPQLGPLIVGSLIGGSIVDSTDRRTLMLRMQLVLAAVSVREGGWRDRRQHPQRRGGDGAGPHRPPCEYPLSATPSKPRARLYSATTCGSETRV